MNKSEFRKKVYADIEGFDEAYIIDSDKIIFDALTSLPELLSAKTVFAYHSVGHEVDTKQIIRFCLDRGQRIALPVCLESGRMIFRLCDSGAVLVSSGPYNIPEPPESAETVFPGEHDVMLVPALCYDTKLNRLGRGAGYYDRFLSGCKAATIGICREKLVYDEIPVESHDEPVSMLITEQKKRDR